MTLPVQQQPLEVLIDQHERPLVGTQRQVLSLKDGKAMRYVPVAAGGTIHVPLAIVDELQSGTEISIVAAADGSGKLILDVGILEVNTS